MAATAPFVDASWEDAYPTPGTLAGCVPRGVQIARPVGRMEAFAWWGTTWRGPRESRSALRRREPRPGDFDWPDRATREVARRVARREERVQIADAIGEALRPADRKWVLAGRFEARYIQ
jgi:hypothetical protein